MQNLLSYLNIEEEPIYYYRLKKWDLNNKGTCVVYWNGIKRYIVSYWRAPHHFSLHIIFNPEKHIFDKIIVSKDNKTFKELELYLNEGIIDQLSGARWEGLTLNSTSFGWGCEYDDFGVKVYTGFHVKGKRCGYGIVYHDTGKWHYEGTWLDGHMHGLIKEYDRLGVFLREGYFIEGKQVFTTIYIHKQHSLNRIHTFLQHLVISNHIGNSWLSFNLSYLPNLHSLFIGQYCFSHICTFHIHDLPFLESIRIEEYSFSNKQENVWFPLDATRSFLIENCPSLHTFVVKAGCFMDYYHIQFKHLNSLKTLALGCEPIEYVNNKIHFISELKDRSLYEKKEQLRWYGQIDSDSEQNASSEEDYAYNALDMSESWCFTYCDKLCITDLPQLQTISIGSYSFYYTPKIEFKNLPCLQAIGLYHSALSACPMNVEEVDKAMLIHNSFSLLHLPSLEAIACNAKSECETLSYFGTVTLKDIPKLQKSNIKGLRKAFAYVSLLNGDQHTAFKDWF